MASVFATAEGIRGCHRGERFWPSRVAYEGKSRGEGGITRPASAARVLPAYGRCLHALALEARAVERVRISGSR
jgi:hypothetical protein